VGARRIYIRDARRGLTRGPRGASERDGCWSGARGRGAEAGRVGSFEKVRGRGGRRRHGCPPVPVKMWASSGAARVGGERPGKGLLSRPGRGCVRADAGQQAAEGHAARPRVSFVRRQPRTRRRRRWLDARLFFEKKNKKLNLKKWCRFVNFRRMGTSRLNNRRCGTGDLRPSNGREVPKLLPGPLEGLFANKKFFLFVKRSLRHPARRRPGGAHFLIFCWNLYFTNYLKFILFSNTRFIRRTLLYTYKILVQFYEEEISDMQNFSSIFQIQDLFVIRSGPSLQRRASATLRKLGLL
jgi:hypothetical protein